MLLLILSALWQFPQSLQGLFFFWFGRVRIHDIDGAVFIVAQPGGLAMRFLTSKAMDPTPETVDSAYATAMGVFILCGSTEAARDPGTRAHELDHKFMGDILGPLFYPALWVAMLITLLQGKRPMRDNWFERRADAAGDAARSKS